MLVTLAGEPLDRSELVRRARRVKLVVTDCDGVLTDGGVHVDAEGNERKRFDVRDGLGCELLRRADVAIAFLSGEITACFARRAEKLAARAYLGVKDKLAAAPEVLAEHGLESLAEIAFVGDDVNDAALLAAVHSRGLTAIPRDAHSSLRPHAHRLCRARGGHGAFREVAEWLLALRRGDPNGRRTSTGAI